MYPSSFLVSCQQPNSCPILELVGEHCKIEDLWRGNTYSTLVARLLRSISCKYSVKHNGQLGRGGNIEREVVFKLEFLLNE